MFERGVNGQKDEGRVNVREHQDDSEGAVEKETDWDQRDVVDMKEMQKGRMMLEKFLEPEQAAGDVSELQDSVEHAVAAKDGLPGVAADKIAGPERNDYELVEQIFPFGGVERQVIRERVAQKERETA